MTTWRGAPRHRRASGTATRDLLLGGTAAVGVLITFAAGPVLSLLSMSALVLLYAAFTVARSLATLRHSGLPTGAGHALLGALALAGLAGAASVVAGPAQADGQPTPVLEAAEADTPSTDRDTIPQALPGAATSTSAPVDGGEPESSPAPPLDEATGRPPADGGEPPVEAAQTSAVPDASSDRAPADADRPRQSGSTADALRTGVITRTPAVPSPSASTDDGRSGDRTAVDEEQVPLPGTRATTAPPAPSLPTAGQLPVEPTPDDAPVTTPTAPPAVPSTAPVTPGTVTQDEPEDAGEAVTAPVPSQTPPPSTSPPAPDPEPVEQEPAPAEDTTTEDESWIDRQDDDATTPPTPPSPGAPGFDEIIDSFTRD